MSLDTQQSRLYAVTCLHCKQPIAIPQLAAELQRNETKRLGEQKCQVFHLRCVKCGKEKPYTISEIIEVESTQDGASWIEAGFSRPPEKSRAATG